MTEDLKTYLINNKWQKNSYDSGWTKYRNSECYSTIDILPNGNFVYDEDCPDVRIPIEDYFKPVSFESEEKLIKFLEKTS